MKPVDDQFFNLKKERTHSFHALQKGETPMKPFERDHHAAQPSVGFHAKQASLTLHC